MRDKKIRVLIIDDSSVVRDAMRYVISQHPRLEVMGAANDPFEAAEFIKKEVPDVITLDIEMPKMDGITFLKRLMSQRPIPVIVCSTLVGSGSRALIAALEGGAVDIIQKPSMGTERFLAESAILIQDKILAASSAKMKLSRPNIKPDINKKRFKINNNHKKIIFLGASTGGTDALKFILTSMPSNSPPILIVQHMPAQFTRAFASHLNEVSPLKVVEASDGDAVEQGCALIAPGDKHMTVFAKNDHYSVKIVDGPLVSRHRPSVDVLFRSAAKYVGGKGIGIIMTGMGRDGSDGLMTMRKSGALTIGQNEESCVVYGMSRVAKLEGAVCNEMDLRDIPEYITCTALR